MNNYQQLQDCLNSIKKYTHKASYEVLLVAYFFSKENMERLAKEYPWVKVIVSNEIRGFSANNNLALRQAKGKYCFVLNDDTYFTMPVIDQLFATMEAHEEITLLSPQILHPDGTVQYSGIVPVNWTFVMAELFHLRSRLKDKSGKYIRQEGLFQTFNIVGAAFLIRTDIFRKVGFFDERYFFGPEDIALSTLLNRMGYTCYVDAEVKLVHLGGATGGVTSKTARAARPAARKGTVILYAEGKSYRKVILSVAVWLNSALVALYWRGKMLFNNDASIENSYYASINVCKSVFSRMTTTEIFKRFYKGKALSIKTSEDKA